MIKVWILVTLFGTTPGAELRFASKEACQRVGEAYRAMAIESRSQHFYKYRCVELDTSATIQRPTI